MCGQHEVGSRMIAMYRSRSVIDAGALSNCSCHAIFEVSLLSEGLIDALAFHGSAEGYNIARLGQNAGGMELDIRAR
jgi:hypothetical protein